MTKDEIIEMARQAGGIDITNTLAGNFTAWINTGTPEFLERFAKLVAQHEREACAGLCDVQASTVAASAEVCAEAIRAKAKE
jgi:dTDP-glucose pyrophosphorylase